MKTFERKLSLHFLLRRLRFFSRNFLSFKTLHNIFLLLFLLFEYIQLKTKPFAFQKIRKKFSLSRQNKLKLRSESLTWCCLWRFWANAAAVTQSALAYLNIYIKRCGDILLIMSAIWCTFSLWRFETLREIDFFDLNCPISTTRMLDTNGAHSAIFTFTRPSADIAFDRADVRHRYSSHYWIVVFFSQCNPLVKTRNFGFSFFFENTKVGSLKQS